MDEKIDIGRAAHSTADVSQAQLSALFEWFAQRDPLRAARLLRDYLDELAQECASLVAT